MTSNWEGELIMKRTTRFTGLFAGVVGIVALLHSVEAWSQGAGGAGGAACSVGGGGASGGGPLGVSLIHCQAWYGATSVGGAGGETAGSLGPGNEGPGFFNSPFHRSYMLSIMYHHDQASDTSVSAAIDKIGKVEVCWIDTVTQELSCPGGTWVIFDRSVAGATPPVPSVVSRPCLVQDEALEGQDPTRKSPIVRCPPCAKFVYDQKAVIPAVVGGNTVFDWGDNAFENRAAFLRVTPAGQTPPAITLAEAMAQANAHGLCGNSSIRAVSSDPRALPHVVSPKPDFTAFDGADQLNVCQGGRFGAGTAAPYEMCLKTHGQATYVQKLMESIVAHHVRIQGGLAAAPPVGVAPNANQQHLIWPNGNSPGGAVLPLHTIMVAGSNGGVAGGNQLYDLGNLLALDIDPTDTPLTLGRRGNGSNLTYLLSVTTHELLHMLQYSWVREVSTDADRNRIYALIFPGEWFHESLPASVMEAACLPNFPNNPPPQQCVSYYKILRTINGDATASYPGSGLYSAGRGILSRPQTHALLSPYESGFFWNYVYQQFSYPQSTTILAHPLFGATGLQTTSSSIQREDDADTRTLASRLDSDQGFDFVGLLFQQLANTPDGRDTWAAMDAALQKHLGRNLRDVVFDFHTSFFLKDLAANVDPRWRIDWAHKDGYTATSTIASLKPILPPTSGDLYAPTRDGLVRARRTMDRGQVCPPPPNRGTNIPACAPAPVPMPFGTTQSVVQVRLGPYGTTALSVMPTGPAWTAPGNLMTIKGSNVLSVGLSPRFRVFRIDGDGQVPKAMCGGSPLHECPVTAQFRLLQPVGTNFSGEFNLTVPIAPDTKEVLLIASNSIGTMASAFSPTFGSTSTPQISLGKIPRVFPRFPAPPTPRPSPLVVKLGQRLTTNVGVLIPQDSITVSMPNCAKANQGPAACNLPSASIQFLPMSGGLSPLAISAPADFFPILPAGGFGTLNVKVDVANLPSATATLEYANRVPTQVTALVMDSTVDMGLFKLPSMKTAAKALLQSLLPVGATPATDKVALLAYAEDASTLTGPSPVDVTASSIAGLEQAIDGMAIFEDSSIGDGVFEAQATLANAFDDLQVGNRPDKQIMIVVNASLNNQNALPELYVNGSATPPTGDGNGSWGGRPLTWPARQAAGLPLPDGIQTIAVGDFADFGRLESLSRLTGSGTVALPLPSDSPIDQAELTRKFADAITASYTNASRYSRILAGTFTSSQTGGLNEPLPGIGAEATELRVIVVGPNAAAQNFFLSGPSGNVQPIAESGDSAAFKVANPTGDWHLRLTSVEGSSAIFFVEASVASPTIELLTQVDVADLPLSSTGQAETGGIAGSPLHIRAIPRDGQAVPGCTVTATVTDPDGVPAPLVLIDDGQHQDGGAGDGVYGTTFGRTWLAGAYGVVIKADCVSPVTATPFARQKSTGITLVPIPSGGDTDSDGMPDAWESAHGLNPNAAADAQQDADGDSLSNVNEFRAGTSPMESDSDGGGESDASEIGAGRNPIAHDDDRVSGPVTLPEAGNGKVLLRSGMGLGAGALLVERAPTETGPWTRLSGVFQPGNTYAVDSGVQNGVQVCYRVRVEMGPVSGWSVPGCVTPAVDPYPPKIRFSGRPPCGLGSDLTLSFTIDDPALPTDAPNSIPVDLGVASSGVTELRYWFTQGPAPTTAVWQPMTNPLVIPNPPTASLILVQVRDAAGNLSEPVRIDISAQSCVVADAGPDQIRECTAAGSATAQVDASASRDTSGAPVTFSWAAPGITFSNPTIAMPTASFPIGTTTATVSVTSTPGGSANDAVQITVLDITPPALIVPPDITITACNSPNIGTATATDTCGGSVMLTNNKPTKFPLGTTVVTYWAVDAFGNAVSKTQSVTAILADDSSCCPTGTTIKLGTSNNDALNGTSGSDCILGRGAQDTINGLGGNDYISGGEGNDVIDGGSGVDRIYGGNGQDQLRGGTGNDVIEGGGGDDFSWGGENDDVIRGGQGQDQIFGENGNDQLFGDDGDDRLEGGSGNDALDGGGLHDVCTGGPGTDTFNLCEVATQ